MVLPSTSARRGDDWQRHRLAGRVVYSTFDNRRPAHQVTELLLERREAAGRAGRDVAIILDSAHPGSQGVQPRAPASGRFLSGGIRFDGLYPPRPILRRCTETSRGGSLTIIATVLVETGSRMDEGIFEEFKATGNMNLPAGSEPRREAPVPGDQRRGVRHQEGGAPAEARGACVV